MSTYGKTFSVPLRLNPNLQDYVNGWVKALKVSDARMVAELCSSDSAASMISYQNGVITTAPISTESIYKRTGDNTLMSTTDDILKERLKKYGASLKASQRGQSDKTVLDFLVEAYELMNLMQARMAELQEKETKIGKTFRLESKEEAEQPSLPAFDEFDKFWGSGSSDPMISGNFSP